MEAGRTVFQTYANPIRIPIDDEGFWGRSRELPDEDFGRMSYSAAPFMELSNATKNYSAVRVTGNMKDAHVRNFSWDSLSDCEIKTIIRRSYGTTDDPGVFFPIFQPKPDITVLRDFLKDSNNDDMKPDFTLGTNWTIEKFVDFHDALVDKVVAFPQNYVLDFWISDFLTESRGNFFGMYKTESKYQLWEKREVAGVNTVYNYMSSPFTASPFHLEDWDLESANINCGGASKVWLFVPKSHRFEFEEKFGPLIDASKTEQNCPAWLKGHRPLVKLETLRKWKIPYDIAFQHPGDLFLIKSGVYHQVCNLGYTMCRAVNFADDFYRPGADCKCRAKHQTHGFKPDVVAMNEIWHKYLKRTETWRRRFEEQMELSKQMYGPIVQEFQAVSPSAQLQVAAAVPSISAGPVCEISSNLSSKTALIPKKTGSSSGEEKKYNCQKCPKVFNRPSKLNEHERLTHSKDIVQFECEGCGKSFPRAQAVKYHISMNRCPGQKKQVSSVTTETISESVFVENSEIQDETNLLD